jgi:hypothetical protein
VNFCVLLYVFSDGGINILQATAVVNSGLLLMAVMGLMFPAVLHFTHSEARQGASEVSLSRFSSCIMLVAYASYLYFQLHGRSNIYSPIGSVSPLPHFISFYKEYDYFSLCSCNAHCVGASVQKTFDKSICTLKSYLKCCVSIIEEVATDAWSLAHIFTIFIRIYIL